MNRRVVLPDQSTSALRASLLSAVERPHRIAVPTPVVAETVDPAALPSAPELLESSPNLQRLCESYHRTHRAMLQRSRQQRLGIAMLVAGVGVGSLFFGRSGAVAPTTLSQLVLAVGAASCIALGMLAVLWVRDIRRLRSTQGDRLLRALQFNCSMPEDRLRAFRRLREPTAAFFDCYGVWRSQNPDLPTGLAAIFGGLDQRRRHPAT